MKDKKNDRNIISLKELNKIEINVIKEEEPEYKENNLTSTNFTINTKEKPKENKSNLPKNSENEKSKVIPKSNLNENINQRINNFINYSNPNLHNRYFSSNTSNHIFRNFIRKTNINKGRDSPSDGSNDTPNHDNDFHFIDNRPYSFTSRTNYSYINKGLDYILGNNVNPNNININQKDIIDYKKRQGYDYKKYHRGKRNNYVNKNIFFSEKVNNLNQGQDIQNLPGNLFNNNYPQNAQLLNNFKNNESFMQNKNNMTSSKQKFLHMNDFLKLENLDMKIMEIGNSLLNFIGNNFNNINSMSNMNSMNSMNSINNINEQNYHLLNINSEINSIPPPIKVVNPGTTEYYRNNNIDFNNISFNMNGNPFFG